MKYLSLLLLLSCFGFSAPAFVSNSWSSIWFVGITNTWITSWNTVIGWLWGNSYSVSAPRSIVQSLDLIASHRRLKQIFIRQLISQWYTGFVTTPPIVITLSWSSYVWSWRVWRSDSLDIAISQSVWPIISISIDPTRRINLFQSYEDLQVLWYVITSSRSRINRDTAARRHNISQSFEQIWPTRVININEKFTFLDKSNYDPGEQKLYQKWYVIKWDEEIPEYGGWICWASTAIYQWIVSNRAIWVIQARSHSNRYRNLYPATIDGIYIKTPGIDSTVYAWSLDLVFRNISDYPIILVTNYDGVFKSKEDVFVLSMPADKGSIQFVKQYKKWKLDCYDWLINTKKRSSCFKAIK